MWWTFAINFIKDKVLGNNGNGLFILILLIPIMAIVIPNIGQIAEKLGFESRTVLKEQVIQQQHDIDALMADNERLKKELEISQAITEVKKQIVKEQAAVIEKVTIETEDIVKKKDKEIKQILASVTDNNISINKEDVKKLKLTPTSAEKQISKTQINALWDSYCSFNNNTECPTTPV